MMARSQAPHQERPRKVGAMTTTLGFFCDDGVVLCADRQQTSDGFHKFPEEKIFAIQDSDWSCLIGYCGSRDTAKAVHQKLGNLLLANKNVTPANVHTGIEQVLATLDETTVSETVFLCGFAASGRGKSLLKTNRYSAHQVSKWDCVGSGDSSVVRFLGDILVNKYNNTSAIAAVLAGLYIIEKAKEYTDGTGGPIDIQILRGDGRFAPPWFKTKAKFQKLTKAVEHDIGGIFFHLTNGNNEEFIERLWSDLRGRVAEFWKD
jgi:20S proteasome alpha/beta subunit